jgi:hypothetical protein
MKNIILFALIVSASIMEFLLLLAAIDWWLKLDESLSDVLNNAVKEEDGETLDQLRLINAISKISVNIDSNRWLGD